jgi:hypothetical protein
MTARPNLSLARAGTPAAVVILLGLAAGVAVPPAPSAPARNGCVACHTDRAALEPLVRPLPPAPAEGEG